MDKKHDISIEGKFIHDIATPISVVKLYAKRLSKICLERQGSDIEQKLIEQILEAATIMESMYENHKSNIQAKKTS